MGRIGILRGFRKYLEGNDLPRWDRTPSACTSRIVCFPPSCTPSHPRDVMFRRALHHIKTLLEMISQFPLTNPSPIESSETGQELDILKLLRQIRSKYKILCSSLGVRPRIYAADGSLIQDSEDGSTPGGTQGKKKNSIWDLEGGDGEKPKQTQQQFLSF